jgi:hypothetical protein
MTRRRLLTCLSALSLILCVGTVALWVRSYWVIGSVSFEHHAGRLYGLSFANGHVTWEIHQSRDPLDRAPIGLRLETTHLGTDDRFEDYWPTSYGPHFAGFCMGQWGAGGPVPDEFEYDDCKGIRTPYWAFVGLAAILPLGKAAGLLRSVRRRRRNRCPPAATISERPPKDARNVAG